MDSHILVPTDFSAHSNAAWSLACSIAHHSGATLRLVHCMEVVAGTSDLQHNDQIDSIKNKKMQHLNRLQSLAEQAQMPVTVECIVGNAKNELPRYCHEHGITLILMGTRGFTGVEKLVWGSTTEYLAKNLTIPVFSVCLNHTENLASPLEQIVVPVDLSVHSIRSIESAAYIARDNGARVTLLYVIDAILYESEYGSFEPNSTDAEREERIRATVTPVLEKNAAPLIELRVPFDIVIRRGHPADEIQQFAMTHRDNLICMSSHGKGSLERLLAGSVTEKIIKTAPCPVLVTRPPRSRT